MLEYPLIEAQELLQKNLLAAEKTTCTVEYELDFIKEQLTTMEVNIARVYNHGVKLRQLAKVSAN
jgi:hypothetical protein